MIGHGFGHCAHIAEVPARTGPNTTPATMVFLLARSRLSTSATIRRSGDRVRDGAARLWIKA